MTTPGKIARFIGPDVELGLFADRSYPTIKVSFTDAERRALRQVGINWYFFELPTSKTREFLENPDGVTNWTNIHKWQHTDGNEKPRMMETKVLIVLYTEASGEFVFHLKAEVLRYRRKDGSPYVVNIPRRCPSIKEACDEPVKQDVAIDAYNLAGKATQHDYPMVVGGVKQLLAMFDELLEVETVVYQDDEKTEERTAKVVRVPRDPGEMKLFIEISEALFATLPMIDVIDGRVPRIEHLKSILGGVLEFHRELEDMTRAAKERETQAAKAARDEAKRLRKLEARTNDPSGNEAQVSETVQDTAQVEAGKTATTDAEMAVTPQEPPPRAKKLRALAPVPKQPPEAAKLSKAARGDNTTPHNPIAQLAKLAVVPRTKVTEPVETQTEVPVGAVTTES